jgi:hypothetical protein
MPHRFVTLAIVVFCVAMNGLLFFRGVWPRLWPGEPPPFTIDLGDEVRRSDHHIRWSIEDVSNDEDHPEKLTEAETWVTYRDLDNLFELHGKVGSDDPKAKQGIARLLVSNTPLTNVTMQSTYWVTREGDLRQMSVTFNFCTSTNLLPRGEDDLEVNVNGIVENGHWFPRYSVDPKDKSKKSKALDRPLMPVPVNPRGCLLNPLQPMDRLRGLRQGQHWQAPLSDPLVEALGAAVEAMCGFRLPGLSGDPRVLEAEVRKGTFPLAWNGQSVPCLVIDYRGTDVHDETSARTWVRKSDGRVLEQDCTAEGRKLRLVRMGE